MKTRRQLIQILPAVPAMSLLTATGAAALLSACGEKTPPPAAATAPAAPAPAPVAAAAPSPAPAAATATGPMVDEKDPQAAALGYVSDASKVDKSKYPKYSDGQACSNCALYQGAAGSTQGGCPLFAGKQVPGKAWCSAYNKKVG